MIRIRSKRHNFRRCGMPHPKEPVDYPDDRFTLEELKILGKEAMLIVEIIPDEPELPPEPAEIEEKEVEAESESEPEVKDELVEAEKEEPGEDELSVDVEIGESPIVLAALAAIDAGEVTKDGKPLVEAMEEKLGRAITAVERDAAWEKLVTD